MNTLKTHHPATMKKLFLFSLIAFGVIVCSAQPKATVVPGRLIMKFKPEAYEQAAQFQPAMRTQGITAATKTLSVGLPTIDALNQKYKATQMRRLFPCAGKHEAKHQQYGLHFWYEISIDESFSPDEAAEIYGNDANIEWAEPVPVINRAGGASEFDTENPQPLADGFPNDPSYNRQWHYENTGQSGGTAGIDIRLPQAWEKTKGDPKVIVAVVDGGVDYTHEDLKDNMWINEGEEPDNGRDDDNNGYIDDIHGYNFLSGGGPVITKDDHGTHVAGTIAATTNNGIGVAGIAGGDGQNRGVRIMSCQAIKEETSSNIQAAIVYAADNGAVILQNSWGLTSGHSQSIRNAISYFIREAGSYDGAAMKGGIAIFSAGNDNTSVQQYPAAYEEVIAVTAINHSGRRASYSNYGGWTDIAAPGGESGTGRVLSTISNNQYGFMQGTSMACPHVSGIAALVLSRMGSETYTPEMLRERLLITARPLPNEPRYITGEMGVGLIDASQALADPIAVTGIAIAPHSGTVYIARTDTLKAIIDPPDAFDRRITWTSSDPSVATIDPAEGVISGIAEGTTTVSVTANDGGFSASVTITVIPVSIDSIRLLQHDLIINKGSMMQIIVIFFPSDATNKNITLDSRNEHIVSIMDMDYVSGMQVGNTYIVATAEDGGHKDSCRVNVVQPVENITLPAGTVRLVVGDTLTVVPLITPPDAFDKTVTWLGNNSSIVSVNNEGLLKARKVGTARITAQTNDGNFTATAQVEVYETEHAPQGFSPNADGVNDYFELTLTGAEQYALTVFDRSGQLYFRSDNYQNNWDGVANTGIHAGRQTPDGTYYYSLTAKSSGKVKTGYVVIKR
jgi:gliding motility-associated-like protein